MAIKFEGRYNKVKITFSDGPSRAYSIYANNEEEAINSLKHYFMKKHNKKKCASCKSDKTLKED